MSYYLTQTSFDLKKITLVLHKLADTGWTREMETGWCCVGVVVVVVRAGGVTHLCRLGGEAGLGHGWWESRSNRALGSGERLHVIWSCKHSVRLERVGCISLQLHDDNQYEELRNY